MPIRIVLSYFFIYLFYQPLHGQGQFNELPVQFFQLPSSFPLINPAYAAIDSGVNITSGNKMNFGSFKIFRTNYINVIARLASKNEYPVRKNHGIGFTLINDANGPYIQQNRAYLTYAYRVSLSEKLSLATGVTLGLENISIESSSISPPGSSFAPDGNIGVWLQAPKSFIGISANQIFGSKLKPLQESIKLLPHLNITGGKNFDIGPNLKYSTVLNVRIAKNNPADIDFYNTILVQNIVAGGINYRHHKGVVLMIGLKNIPFRQGRHLASGWFSYSIPFSKYVISNLQTYEITLSYKIF